MTRAAPPGRRTFGAGLALCLALAAGAVRAEDVAASPPQALSVTIYRAPWRNGGSLNLHSVDGFALIAEKRTVRLALGENRIRFEGVADGILPQSAIVSGLPEGVEEKNEDSAVLSPSALIRAALGAGVTLTRVNRKTGRAETIAAKILSADNESVVFETAAGIEALRCSGLAERFAFSRVPAGLGSTPTLSTWAHAKRPVTAVVTLSYLADGFDWAADYTASLAADGKTLDLGAWITLANVNSAALPNATTQIVAGRLNRVGEQAWIDRSPRVIATCWPQGTTSDVDTAASEAAAQKALDEIVVRTRAGQRSFLMNIPPVALRPAVALPPPPPPEQLGDLKLYRTPRTITIASHGIKQIRLIDQPGVAYARLYQSDLWSQSDGSSTQAETILRTKNDLAHRLGLPLPAGHVVVYQATAHGRLLAGETDLRDTAADEDIDLKLGPAPDVQVRQTRLETQAEPPRVTPLTPAIRLVALPARVSEQVEVSNAGAAAIAFELRLQVGPGAKVTDANPPMGLKDGRPIFHLTVPAQGRAVVTYSISD